MAYAEEDIEHEVSVEIISDTDSESSNNAYLKRLELSSGTLTPEFDKEILQYDATVRNDISEVDVVVAPDDGNADVLYIKGNRNLKVGENKIEIKVEAESGDTKTYVITLTREEKEDANAEAPDNTNEESQEIANEEENPDTTEDLTLTELKKEKLDVEITYKDEQYRVKSSFDDVILPKELTEGTVVIGGKEVVCFSAKIYDFDIIYARHPGESNYTMYAVSGAQLTKCVRIENNGSVIYLMTPPVGTFDEQYKETTVNIEDQEVDAYSKKSGSSNLYYLYGVNATGKYEKFIYDSNTEMFTHELDLSEDINAVEDNQKDTIPLWNFILFGILGVCIIAGTISFVVVLKRRDE